MPEPIATLIERHRGTGHSPGARARMVRIVVRLDRGTVTKLDDLARHFPDASRASLVRAFVALGVQLADEHVKAEPPAPEAAP